MASMLLRRDARSHRGPPPVFRRSRQSQGGRHGASGGPARRRSPIDTSVGPRSAPNSETTGGIRELLQTIRRGRRRLHRHGRARRGAGTRRERLQAAQAEKRRVERRRDSATPTRSPFACRPAIRPSCRSTSTTARPTSTSPARASRASTSTAAPATTPSGSTSPAASSPTPSRRRSRAAPETTPSSAAPVPRRSTATPATTRSTLAVGTTPSTSGAATTRSSGIPARAATPSTAGPATTR